MIKGNTTLSERLHKIKHHDIKLRYHKSQEIYDELTKFFGTPKGNKTDTSKPETNKIVILKDMPYDPSLPDEEKDKLVIRNINDKLTLF